MNGSGENIMSEGLSQELASTTTPKKDPHLGGRDIRPEGSGTEALKMKHEQDRQKDREFLGMYDIGFNPQKVVTLEQQINETNRQLTEYQVNVYEERKKLEAEKKSGRTLGAPLPLARITRGETIKVDPVLYMQESRRQQFAWGFRDEEEKRLKSTLDELQRKTYIEKDKRPDSVDLDEAWTELENTGRLPEAQYDLNADRAIISRNESVNFQGDMLTNEYLLKNVQEISDQVKKEVWFHTTKHLDRMIQNGGLSTASWLRKNDDAYHRKLAEHSVAQGFPMTNNDITVRLHNGDTDKIYFSTYGFEDDIGYGSNVIAFAPEDIMLDTNLYYYPDGQQNRAERVVSDVVDSSQDRLPENGTSNLQISLDRAYIGVPKSGYRETVRQLLLTGYSKKWIKEHVFSYRGEGVKSEEGKRVAVREIRRRIELKRETRGKVEMHAVPNADKKQGIPKVWQISSKQTVNFVDNAPEVPIEENERPLKISFTRDDLNAVLNDPNHTPQDILNLLDKDFGGILDSPVGVWEGYTLRQHTNMMMNQYRKYFADKPLSGGVDSKLIEVVYSFHDMGKPKAVSEYRKDKQHEYTVDILNEVMPQLEYNEAEIALATSLVKGEAIGKYIISGNLENSVDQIKKAQLESGLNLKDFWDLLKIYYMCDAGSYTEDAGGTKSLDSLFKFNYENGQAVSMDFSEGIRPRIEEIEQRLSV